MNYNAERYWAQWRKVQGKGNEKIVKTGLMVCAWSQGGSKYDAGRKSVWRESKLCKPQGRGMLNPLGGLKAGNILKVQLVLLWWGGGRVAEKEHRSKVT